MREISGVAGCCDDELNGDNGYPDGKCTRITCKECEIIYKKEVVQSTRYQDRLEAECLEDAQAFSQSI